MKKVAVIIKHPFRDFDWRIDIVEVPENASFEKIKQQIEDSMIGPFQVIGLSDRIDFNRKIDTTIL